MTSLLESPHFILLILYLLSKYFSLLARMTCALIESPLALTIGRKAELSRFFGVEPEQRLILYFWRACSVDRAVGDDKYLQRFIEATSL